MASTGTLPEVKRIGETGQVSVGKSLAGRLVRVEPAPGGIMLRFVVDVPENEAWWLHEPYKSKLKDALTWAGQHPPTETDLDALTNRAKRDSKEALPSPAKRPKQPGTSKRAARRAK